MPPNDTVARLTYAQWLLERNLSWVAQAEVKVAVVISLDIGMVSAVAAAYTTTTNKTLWAIVLSVAFGLLMIAALGCAAMVVSPQTDGPARSFLFFGAVCKLPAPDYQQALRNATDGELLEDLSSQIHRNAEIACRKHYWVKKAILWSFISSVFWICAISQLVK